MSVADNYDNSIKTLNRKETMYLSVINSQDAIIRPFKKLYTQRDWSTNLFNLDIEGSQPRKFGIFTNKVDFINKNDDIERSNPKIIHYHLKKPEYNLNNRDIEKSFPSAVHFKTKRVTNPLEPNYKFPEAESYPPEIPKFIRDSIDIKDIKGASPQKNIYFLKRETMSEKLKNIEGAQSRIPYVRRSVGNTKYNYLDYSDVNNFVFKTKRHTSTLDPIYIFKKKEDLKKSFFHGPIEKSKPSTNYPYYYKPSLNLKTDDIKGSNAGSTNYINKFKGNNSNLNISDIQKTNSGSLKKGITTTRCINPLIPKYQYLGEKEEKMRSNSVMNLKKKCKSIPIINFNNENEKNKENGAKDNNKFENIGNNINMSENISNKINIEENGQDIKINKNINDKEKLSNRLNKFKINKFSINLINKDKELKKSNSSMNLLNKNMRLENNNEKNKKIIRFTPLLNSQKPELINNKPEFDKTIFGKKPYPFYGYFHDPGLQSRENMEHLEEIEKSKHEKELNKAKYAQYIFDKEHNYIAEEYKKNPNENNLLFISDNPNMIQTNQIKKRNVDEWYNFNLNDKGGLYKFKNKSLSMRHLGPRKKFYSEKLDSFLNVNNIQKNIDERNDYNINSPQEINPSEISKKALNE